MSAERPAVHWGPDGLVPGIVQDASDGRVLMLGWLDGEALAATLASGTVHFHSRSRGRLWRKGETSGHTLTLVSLALDCDADALLLTVRPTGPTCHTGARSCFDAGARVDRPGPTAMTAGSAWLDGSGPTEGSGTEDRLEPAAEQGFAWLETLWATIADRAAHRPEGSYTARLLDGGVDVAGRKVTEEATEVLMAAKDDAQAEARAGDRSTTGLAPGRGTPDRSTTQAALVAESADLLFHLLVLWAERGSRPRAIVDVLRARAAGGG